MDPTAASVPLTAADGVTLEADAAADHLLVGRAAAVAHRVAEWLATLSP